MGDGTSEISDFWKSAVRQRTGACSAYPTPVKCSSSGPGCLYGLGSASKRGIDIKEQKEDVRA